LCNATFNVTTSMKTHSDRTIIIYYILYYVFWTPRHRSIYIFYYSMHYVCRRRLPCICWACHPSALACVWAACTGRWTDARAWGSLATGTCTARRRLGERCPRAVFRCAVPAVLDLAHRLLPCTLPIRTPILRRRDCLQTRRKNDIWSGCIILQ